MVDIKLIIVIVVAIVIAMAVITLATGILGTAGTQQTGIAVSATCKSCLATFACKPVGATSSGEAPSEVPSACETACPGVGDFKCP